MTKTKEQLIEEKQINKDITHLIGCTGIFGKNGNLYIHPKLKAYRMVKGNIYPEYRIMGDDNNGNVLLTADGLFISSLPKKFIREIFIK